MRRVGLAVCASVLFFLAARVPGQPEEPFRPKGVYNNSVHRFHPDLEARLNVVRYTRWKTLESAWTSGITTRLEGEIASRIAELLLHVPRFAPEADRVAPLFARDAAPVFRALRWGQTFEQQLLDVLASSDAGRGLSQARLERAYLIYRRERYALSEPADAATPGEPSSATAAVLRVLMPGTRLFILAAKDLTTPDFAQQRWLVKRTIADFDRSFQADRPAQDATYRVSAPAVAEAFPGVAGALDRLNRFRGEVLEALAAGGATALDQRQRGQRLREVARRYGLSPDKIRGR